MSFVAHKKSAFLFSILLFATTVTTLRSAIDEETNRKRDRLELNAAGFFLAGVSLFTGLVAYKCLNASAPDVLVPLAAVIGIGFGATSIVSGGLAYKCFEIGDKKRPSEEISLKNEIASSEKAETKKLKKKLSNLAR